jgi:hypothetical protein
VKTAEPRALSAADLVGLLAEPSRRRVFAALILGARTLPEVVAATGLPGSDVAVTLQKLVSGGLVSSDRARARYEAVEGLFKAAMRTEQKISTDRGDGAGSYFRRGRLLTIPGQPDVRGRVLAIVIEAFDFGRAYNEAQVNALCAEWYDDWVSLRRALVDEGLLLRDHRGTYYQRPHRDGSAPELDHPTGVPRN